MFRHPQDSIVIEEEGPLSRCVMCDMFVTPRAIKQGHHGTAICLQGKELKRKRAVAQEHAAARNAVFQAYGKDIGKVEEFDYLGRPLTADDNDWPALRKNLQKARGKWMQISKVLRTEGANPKICASFYKAVVQTVLLFGSETWVISPAMLRTLEGFHHRVARQLSGNKPEKLESGEWRYQPREKAREACGLRTMEEYIAQRRKYIIEYIIDRPIFKSLNEARRPPGSMVLWQDQFEWATADE
jgi:hypothetical protein